MKEALIARVKGLVHFINYKQFSLNKEPHAEGACLHREVLKKLVFDGTVLDFVFIPSSCKRPSQRPPCSLSISLRSATFALKNTGPEISRIQSLVVSLLYSAKTRDVECKN